MNKEEIAKEIDNIICKWCSGISYTALLAIANYIEQNYIHKSEVKTAEVKRLIDNKSYYEALMEIFGNISK